MGVKLISSGIVRCLGGFVRMPFQLGMSRRQGDDTHFWVRARELDGGGQLSLSVDSSHRMPE